MKLGKLLLILTIPITTFAGEVALPQGGIIHVDTQVWEVQSTKNITGSRSLLFIHKKDKDLIGMSFGGAVQAKGSCDPDHSQPTWKVCTRDIPLKDKISHQITLQRSIASEASQSYVLTFNYPVANAKKVKAALSQFVKEIGHRE